MRFSAYFFFWFARFSPSRPLSPVSQKYLFIIEMIVLLFFLLLRAEIFISRTATLRVPPFMTFFSLSLSIHFSFFCVFLATFVCFCLFFPVGLTIFFLSLINF